MTGIISLFGRAAIVNVCSNPTFPGHASGNCPRQCIESHMRDSRQDIFDEKYRVVAVESEHLIVKGERSGEILIINADPDIPLTQEDYPAGRLITLSDPATGLVH